MPRHLAATLSSFLAAFGVTKFQAIAFLAVWEYQSVGHPDIAARGIWLLGLSLLSMAVAGCIIGAALTLVLIRRWPVQTWRKGLLVGIGAIGGSSCVAVGIDPSAVLLRAVAFGSPVVYFGGSLLVAIALVYAAVALLQRGVRWAPRAAAT